RCAFILASCFLVTGAFLRINCSSYTSSLSRISKSLMNLAFSLASNRFTYSLKLRFSAWDKDLTKINRESFSLLDTVPKSAITNCSTMFYIKISTSCHWTSKTNPIYLHFFKAYFRFLIKNQKYGKQESTYL